MHTGFLDHEGATLADAIDEPTPAFVAAALSMADAGRGPTRSIAATDWDPWSRLQGWRA
jgi:hypothetical protein